MAGLYLQVEVLELDDDRLIDAGMEGRGVYGVVGLLAKRTETDGWVTMAQLRKEGATAEQVARLTDLRLLDSDGDGRVRQSGWLDRNPSQAAIDQRREAKAEAGRKGNHDRWGHPDPFDSCPKCQVVAPSETGAIPSDPMRSPDTESKSESDSKSARPGSISGDLPVPPEPVAAEPLPVVDPEQAARKALNIYCRTKAANEATGDPTALAAKIGQAAMNDGRSDLLRDFIADGLTAEQAATKLLDPFSLSADRVDVPRTVPADESTHPLLRSVPAFCGDCEKGWVFTEAGALARCPACNPNPIGAVS